MPFKCLSCTQCCKRYNISLLPEEAQRIAKFLNLSLQQFFEQKTELFLQLFPSPFKENDLIVSSSNFPKELVDKIYKECGFCSTHFLVLPGIVLKRKEQDCIFLKDNLCEIHEVKPAPCEMFPFISWNPQKDLRESYKFCAGLNASNEQVLMQEKHIQKHEAHYAKVKQNFEQIKTNSFKQVFPFLPKKGKLLIEGKQISEISLKEFEEILELI
ncbi:MAG: YkgJ family cysteine cluster protein [archaeon]|nr:YkgJ family cysteine cluster protein [archaeon]